MKINIRESLNKIDLATNNKYDLLNTFDSKKLSDNSKKKLAEAIDNNSIASINRVLHESSEQLYKVVISSGATKRNFESALYEDEAEGIVDYYGGRWIDENGFEWSMYVEEDDDSTEHAMVDDDYDMEDDDERAQREIDAYDILDEDWGPDEWEETDFLDNDGKKVYINNIKEAEDIDDLKDIVHDLYWHDKGLFAMLRNFPKDKSFEWIQNRMIEVIESTMNESLTEASYGGAYDIEDDMFFTKEEIVDFVEEICVYLGDVFGYQYNINNVYMDGPRKLYINIYDNNYIEVESTFDIDMRKIRKPSDLSKVYGLTIENWFQKAFAREYRDAGLDESLNKKNLKEDLSDLDLFLSTQVDTKQYNDETFRALKNLVSEYKNDFDSLDQWAPEHEKEPFVKKWYKLADKCKEIAANGIRGITGYGRTGDFIKLKVIDLARLVDNTFPWYTRNNLAKFNKLESLKESLDFFDVVDNIPLNVLNDDICQGDVFTGFYFNSEESANRFANYLERKGFVTDQSEDSSYAKGFNYKVSIFNDIEGKYFDDETYEESLTEDTVKQNGKWVNKGSEGTHGKFKTKKAADAQRRAIWVNWNK